MSQKNTYADFLGKVVNVGVPHYTRDRRLFFVTGLVTGIEDEFLILKIKNGMRKIPFSDIMQISINHREKQ